MLLHKAKLQFIQFILVTAQRHSRSIFTLAPTECVRFGLKRKEEEKGKSRPRRSLVLPFSAAPLHFIPNSCLQEQKSRIGQCLKISPKQVRWPKGRHQVRGFQVGHMGWGVNSARGQVPAQGQELFWLFLRQGGGGAVGDVGAQL